MIAGRSGARHVPGRLARLLILAGWLAAAMALNPGLLSAGEGEAASGAPSSEVLAASALPDTAGPDDLEALARLLEDPVERDRLVAALRTLAAMGQVQPAPPPARAEPALGRMSEWATDRLGVAAAEIAQVGRSLGRIPEAVAWIEAWLAEPGKQERLIGLAWRFLVMIAAGFALEQIYRRFLRPARLRLEQAPDAALATVFSRFLLHTLILFGRPAAFAFGAFGLAFLLPMTGKADQVLAIGAFAFVAARLVMALGRTLLSPHVPSIRPLPFGDETAFYLHIWLRRMVVIFVYLLAFIEALRVVGIPADVSAAAHALAGFLFALFLTFFVLQNRHLVALSIRGGRETGVGHSLRDRLAGIWHILAIAYIVLIYGAWLLRIEGGVAHLLTATLWTVLILIVARLFVLATRAGLLRLFHVNAELEARFPGLEERSNRYLPLMKGFLGWLIMLVALVLVLDVWGFDSLAWLASPEGMLILRKLVLIAVIVLVALLAWEMVSLVIARYLNRLEAEDRSSARVRTLLPLLRTASLIFIALMAILVVLSELGVNIAPLLAGAGVIGLAIGFGAQKLVQDVITGMFMLVENTLAVGDVVRLGPDHVGVVEEISIRTVRLRDLNGAVHTLPFSEVRTALNLTRDFAYHTMNIGVAYRENVDHVMEVLRDIGEDLRSDEVFSVDILEPIEVLGLQEFADSALIIRARLKTSPGRQWAVGREFNRRMKARFDAEGIEIPFPHRTLYFGEDREGQAPPLRWRDAGDDPAPARPAPSAAAAGPGVQGSSGRSRGPRKPRRPRSPG